MYVSVLNSLTTKNVSTSVIKSQGPPSAILWGDPDADQSPAYTDPGRTAAANGYRVDCTGPVEKIHQEEDKQESYVSSRRPFTAGKTGETSFTLLRKPKRPIFNNSRHTGNDRSAKWRRLNRRVSPCVHPLHLFPFDLCLPGEDGNHK